ncbi:EAL domain-containing protein [Herbaspirillum sp. HC18]|nr:EAL domain-containing protein [Herbaspirillum sp. HC18]
MDPQQLRSTAGKASRRTKAISGDAAQSFADSLLKSSNDLIVAVDHHLRFIAFNTAFEREFELVFGKPVKVGQRLGEVLQHLPGDRQKVTAMFRRALAGESLRVTHDFGDEHFLRKTYQLTFNPVFGTNNNRPLYAAVVGRDLTLLIASERRFDALLEAAPDATIIVRTDGTIDAANAHVEQMFGYGPGQMRGMPVEKLIPARFNARHTAHRHRYTLRPAARPMGSGKSSLRGLRADGTEFPVEISLNPLEAGGENMIVAAIRDMTLRQRAEDELRALSIELERRVAQRTEELEQANRDFRATFEHASVGIAQVAPDGNWLQVNRTLCGIVGYDKEEMLTLTFQDITHPDDLDADLNLMYRLMAGDISTYVIDKRYIRKNGDIVWVNLSVSLVRNSLGVPKYFICVVKDIDDAKRAEAELVRHKQRLELAIASTGLGLFDYYPQTGLCEWSVESKRHFGLSPGAFVDQSVFLQGLHPDDREHVEHALEQAMKRVAGGHFSIEHRTIGIEDGLERWVEVRGQVLFDEHDQPVRCIGTALDISEKKRTDERVRQAALHDPLTGLPNRGLLFEYARHVFGHAQRARRHSAVLFVDLDRFKPINDNHGHEVGDKILKEVARRLEQSTRSEDIVFRLGGDEFLILLPEVEDDTNAGDVARHMSHSVTQPYLIDGLELALSPSVGISIYPRDGTDIDTLINHADAAMYHAKQEGRNNIRFYSEELAARSQIQSKIEDRLTEALNDDAFRLHYQPVIDMQSSRIVGVEALIRWPHEDLGPDLFVPVAEATGHIARIGEWVIGEACRQHKRWRNIGLPAIPIAVNVSAVQFRNNDFANQFARTLEDFAVSTTAFQVEVTETALMENLDRAIELLARLQAMGIQIALDDFGTGYSSLNYLSRLPINKIKVDKSFIQRIEFDMTSRAITEAVIALGRSLKLDVVAEGIESEETLSYLRDHGCNQAQGYHLCKPVPADVFESWYMNYCGMHAH